MIRSALKRGLKKALGIPSRTEPPQPAPPRRAPPPTPVVEAAPRPAPVAEAAPVEDHEAVEAIPFGAPAEDTVGGPIPLGEVQEILDDMVRPALQSDGGDITLLKIENNDIYVKLVGSCSSCPSSIMTMKLGVEALLKEEFPAMGELIQVD